ncbi:hypothetical protein HNV10_02605 [Winogradskyella litoriviva]|uniref:Uncharacterized protein n=1 Tax=Winogradskyella litoriviva TaxID=1220182 RepID=A0ABX2E2T1_9FLAO|nr:hypothetical protein [Winogradskyella litoriviva]NRD22114.1 hypothetical protein [Winogradskyella litoriviva]
MLSFIATAQNSKFNSIEDSVTIKPTLTLMDLNEFSFFKNDTSSIFSTFDYSKKLNTQLVGLKFDMAKIEIMRDGFIVFYSKGLKSSFFRDFNITYRRAELKRLLPKIPDYRNYDPRTNL